MLRDQALRTVYRGKRRTLAPRGAKTALREERQSVRLSHASRAVPSWQEGPSALAWLPHLAQGFLQLLPVGCVAPLQAL